ncbi:3-hydroxyacyl-CoA dehydrogenase family protein [Amycolatopsis sp. WGS_07]|uniref:3-hydroxyacyl-CoA dehydrogenase family protein n=1 Tax=Amycolatopsis sp. WGS_07 TaxID=3076764 RepID=UPI003872AC3E
MRTANPDAVFVTTTSGFIVNALLFPYLNRAVKLLQDRQATADEIDEVMTLACGDPLGPIRLLDVVGHLAEFVAAGYFSVKSGASGRIDARVTRAVRAGTAR